MAGFANESLTIDRQTGVLGYQLALVVLAARLRAGSSVLLQDEGIIAVLAMAIAALLVAQRHRILEGMTTMTL